ncbi:MAG: inositol monophosphatase [Candidatus Omnitrophica bacterium]|jgi:myo-inositol-1(or 4)-monophosphatase|nr:inositol monophosphatase [Candidatus Omnitrophota bacterium]
MGDMVNLAVDAAKEAGIHLLNNFGKIGKIESKGDRNLATNFDKEAEQIIVDKVKSKFPGHGILAEEGGGSSLDSDFIWIIDPLDGTHNFIRNINIFGVSIGILHRNKFVAGVIYMPVDDELYVGEKNNGAYKNNEKICVSSTKELKECSISFDSSIRYSPDVMLNVLGDLSKEIFNVRMLGSSARALSYVTEGKLDFSVEFHDRPWDFAGSVCILEEAGGKITDLKGQDVTHETIGYIASNGITHSKIQRIVFSRINPAQY